MNKYMMLYILMVFIGSCAQILLKISALEKRATVLKEYFNVYVIIAYALFFFSNLFSIYSYKGMELKSGAALQTLGYIFVMILSRLLLKEKLTKNIVLGNLTIIAGILVFYIH